LIFGGALGGAKIQKKESTKGREERKGTEKKEINSKNLGPGEPKKKEQ